MGVPLGVLSWGFYSTVTAVATCSSRPSPPLPSFPRYAHARRSLASHIPRPAQDSSPTPSPGSPLPKALIKIQKSRVIACLRAQDDMLAIEAARAAIRGGISVLEVVMSTPRALEVIKRLIQEHPSSTIGVGTVLNAEDAKKAVHAGAKFLMSPGTVMEILRDLQGGEVLYIPGVMTPTEGLVGIVLYLWCKEADCQLLYSFFLLFTMVIGAYNAGATIVKVYPVSLIGGENYISALKKPFSHIPVVASQGITIDSMGRYIEAGASAVVLSDAIFNMKAMRQRDFDTIHRLAQLATSNGCRAEK